MVVCAYLDRALPLIGKLQFDEEDVWRLLHWFNGSPARRSTRQDYWRDRIHGL